MPLLAIDVGAGTQDLLLFQEDVALEGSIKLVLPSPTVIVAGRIERARARGRDIFLQGPTMGGGASTAAIRWHLSAGLKVYATPAAAATINDNLERVAALGVRIQEEPPEDAEVIFTGDIDIPAIERALGQFDISLPKEVAVAVQDHGYSPTRSNRLVRIEHMSEAIRAGGNIEAFAYRTPPQAMTRMISCCNYLREMDLSGLLMDTGPAAIFGAALDPRCMQPAMVINFGNGHTVASILCEDRITGLFEHHTGQLTPEKLRLFVDKLCHGDLENSEVFEDGGHGAYIEEAPDEIRSVVVTGPRRHTFIESGALPEAIAAAPGGDMMITGCIGLLEAWTRKEDLWR
ncbi:MAG: DUF1786 domain-containing protein [Methanotrichaceae archaeon]|nr:DUF1786 domain-containing protein [Methanotrichaceae archaeon]